MSTGGQYILQSFEQQGDPLPFSCRNGCCTSCAVRVQAGPSTNAKPWGCPGAAGPGLWIALRGEATGPLEATQDEDEVYELQFGRPSAVAVRGLPLDEE